MLNTTLVKVQTKGCITIPFHLRTKIGVQIGDIMDVTAERGKIIFTLKKKSGRSDCYQ